MTTCDIEVYMTDEHINPDSYEQLCLLNIESQNKVLVSDIENFCMNIRRHVATYQDLLSMIDSLKKYETYFLCYKPFVQRLDKLERYQSSKRLEEVIDDIRKTLAIFEQIHIDMLGDHKNMKHDVIVTIKNGNEQQSTTPPYRSASAES